MRKWETKRGINTWSNIRQKKRSANLWKNVSHYDCFLDTGLFLPDSGYKNDSFLFTLVLMHTLIIESVSSSSIWAGHTIWKPIISLKVLLFSFTEKKRKRKKGWLLQHDPSSWVITSVVLSFKDKVNTTCSPIQTIHIPSVMIVCRFLAVGGHLFTFLSPSVPATQIKLWEVSVCECVCPVCICTRSSVCNPAFPAVASAGATGKLDSVCHWNTL